MQTEETEIEEESLPSETTDWTGDDPVEEVEPTEEEETEETEADAEEADAEESEEESEDGETQDEPNPEEMEKPADKPKTPAVPLTRFNQIYRERSEYKERYEKLKSQYEQKDEPAESGPPKRPKLTYNEEEDQRNLDEYERKREEYVISQATKRIKREAEEAEERRRQEQEQERINKALESDPEYAELVREVVEEGDAFFEQITPELGQAIREQGTDFEKYVLKNRNSVLPQLGNLSGVRLGLEIGKIVSSIQKPSAAKTVKKKESKAPPPINRKSKTKTVASVDVSGWR